MTAQNEKECEGRWHIEKSEQQNRDKGAEKRETEQETDELSEAIKEEEILQARNKLKLGKPAGEQSRSRRG